MLGTLFIVATPIGNLSDITHRAIDTLREADAIFAEDTRVTRKILSRYQIQKPLYSYRDQIHERATRSVLSLLRQGKHVAFVTDAGTPGVSDPGARLVETLVREGVSRITPVPGPSAVMAALSVSGFSADRFYFAGFPPHKKGRSRFFQTLAQYPETIVVYESPHRLQKTLHAIAACIDKKRPAMVAKELTKIYEHIWRGNLETIIASLADESVRGEWVIVIGATPRGS